MDGNIFFYIVIKLKQYLDGEGAYTLSIKRLNFLFGMTLVSIKRATYVEMFFVFVAILTPYKLFWVRG